MGFAGSWQAGKHRLEAEMEWLGEGEMNKKRSEARCDELDNIRSRAPLLYFTNSNNSTHLYA